MDKSKISFLVSLIAVVIAIGGYFFPQVANTLGAYTTGTAFPHGISVGLPANTPTNIADEWVGNCNLIGADVSVAATTSAPFDCAVTGVQANDIVQMTGSTTAASLSGGWIYRSAHASSTAGYITVSLLNLTGTAAIPSVSSAGSSTQYAIFRTQ